MNAAPDASRWMDEAALIATKALCLRAKCGTVIVKDGEVIGEGYNAPPQDDINHRECLNERPDTGKPGYDRTCCVHAEWRAIMDALKRNADCIEGATLYFARVDELGQVKRAGMPFCTVCSRLALDAGIREFVLWHDDDKGGLMAYPTAEYNRLSYEYVHPVESML